MSKQSIMGRFDSEKQEAPKLTPAQAIKCKAHNCPLNGSMNMGGDGWLCTYHVKAFDGGSAEVTAMLRDNMRLINIEKTAAKLKPEEFDALQKSGGVELHELMQPVKGEVFLQWQDRIKQTVHKVFKKKTNAIVEEQMFKRSGGRNGISKAVRDLTSGVLMPN